MEDRDLVPKQVQDGESEYSCVVFDDNSSRVAFTGSLSREMYGLLIERGALANSGQDRIPPDARTFGQLVFRNAAETRTIPLYEWAQDTMSGCRLELNGTTERCTLFLYRDKDVLLATLRSLLHKTYNIVTQEDWDERRLDPRTTSIAAFGNRGLKLALTIGKAKFRGGEPIRVQLKLANTGPSGARIGNILPYRSSANPPRIQIYNGANEMAEPQSHAGIVENVLNENETLVDAGKAITLFDADLRQLPGLVFRSLGPDGWGETRSLDSLSLWFKEGVYKVKGSFAPLPLGQASTSDLEFEVAEVSSKATD